MPPRKNNHAKFLDLSSPEAILGYLHAFDHKDQISILGLGFHAMSSQAFEKMRDFYIAKRPEFKLSSEQVPESGSSSSVETIRNHRSQLIAAANSISANKPLHASCNFFGLTEKDAKEVLDIKDDVHALDHWIATKGISYLDRSNECRVNKRRRVESSTPPIAKQSAAAAASTVKEQSK